MMTKPSSPLALLPLLFLLASGLVVDAHSRLQPYAQSPSASPSSSSFTFRSFSSSFSSPSASSSSSSLTFPSPSSSSSSFPSSSSLTFPSSSSSSFSSPSPSSSSSSLTFPSSSSPSSSSAATNANYGTNKGKVGVCHDYTGVDNLPSPTAIVQLLKTHKIPRVRLFSPDPAVLRAFKGSGTDLMIGIPNANITYLSTATVDTVVNYLKFSIFAFVDASQVSYLGVGNEVFHSDPLYTPNLVPAMRNLHKALQKLGLDDKIKVSAPQVASSILGVSFPPSAGQFTKYLHPAMEQLLRCLSETGAPLMVNMQPFSTYVDNPLKVTLNYVLFGVNKALFHDDGKAYSNMFDANVDALVAAMQKLGFSNIPVMVTGTGWPTMGNSVATPQKAAAYAQGIIDKATKGLGTPMRPDNTVDVFLSNLFDQNKEDCKEYQKHFGIFNVDGTKVFNISFVP